MISGRITWSFGLASAERVDALHAYADRLATIAGQGRDHTLDDGDEIARPTVALREVL